MRDKKKMILSCGLAGILMIGSCVALAGCGKYSPQPIVKDPVTHPEIRSDTGYEGNMPIVVPDEAHGDEAGVVTPENNSHMPIVTPDRSGKVAIQ